MRCELRLRWWQDEIGRENGKTSQSHRIASYLALLYWTNFSVATFLAVMIAWKC